MSPDRASYPPIYIHLDIPASFRAKAQFAFNTLLSGYRVSPRYVEREKVAEEGGIIYGLQLNREHNGANGVVCIQSRPETWAYFESRTPYPLHQVVRLSTDQHSTSQPVPVLFGEPRITQLDQVTIIDADIIASAFFWLSDWQEVYTKERDEHGRIPFTETLQHALGVGQCPLVNEYAHLLKVAGQQAGLAFDLRKWPNGNYALALTFDFDGLRKKRVETLWEQTKQLANRKSPFRSIRRWGKAVQQTVTPSDPIRASVKKIMDRLDQDGLNATFFLKSIIERHELDERDYLQSGFFRSLLDTVKSNGHELAYHSSYDAGVNPHLLESELEQLRTYTDVEDIVSHRSHYLRYQPDILVDELCRADVRIDSTKGWAEQIGFRTGCCWPHRWYDVHEDKVTEIWEVPMTVMDLQLSKYMRLNAEQAIERIRKQIDTVVSWNGITVWNLHEHLYDPVEAPGWDYVFEASLQYALDQQPTVATLTELRDLWIQNV